MNVNLIIAQTFNIHEDQVIDDLSYQSIPEWNSMPHISLMLALEKALGIKINNELLMQLTSVKAIKKFVKNITKTDRSNQNGNGKEKIIDSIKKDHSKGNFDSKVDCDSKDQIKIHYGLNNIVFDDTSITKICGKTGRLEYRGYPINELAESSTYEEVAYLLLYKKLPTKSKLKKFNNQLKIYSTIDTL